MRRILPLENRIEKEDVLPALLYEDKGTAGENRKRRGIMTSEMDLIKAPDSLLVIEHVNFDTMYVPHPTFDPLTHGG
jgi:hypothetical protein